ncbi:MAG: septum formation initiator family protein [Candidatus Kerfeldbacteria bacterium]|nr:septum formation initiator family protein [Candidatus Kerfeldbacteria bacterium]
MSRVKTRSNTRVIWTRPSWWAVVISGALLLVFSVAIVREVLNWHQIHQQVSRLRQQISVESRRQKQLQDLIHYLQSPTFQEREARLDLGLKKNGERVIVVPATNDSLSSNPSISSADQTSTAPVKSVDRWWGYFFGPTATARPSSTSSTDHATL